VKGIALIREVAYIQYLQIYNYTRILMMYFMPKDWAKEDAYS